VKFRLGAALGLIALSVGCADPVLAPGRSTSPAALFDAVWREFDLQYSMFTLKRVNWDSIGAVYRPRALAAPNDAAFARVLGEMLLTLHDRHVSFGPTTAGNAIAYLSASDSAPAAYDGTLIETRYLTNATGTSGGHVRYGLLKPRIGYLRLASFYGNGWAGEVDEAIAALRDVESMIVDLRCNAGGTNPLAIEIAGRFADKSRTFGYVRIRNGPSHDDFTDYIAETLRPAGPAQFRGRVIVLTDRKMYSSAEDFVLAMRSLPNVTTMGDTTGGSSGKPIARELANGWTYQLSSWIEYTPDRVPFEGVGLGPDVYTGPSARGKSLPVTDPVLDRAIVFASAAASR
jgi:hypothetical protein